MAPPTKRRKRNVVVSSPPSSGHEDSDNEYRDRSKGKATDFVSTSPSGSSSAPKYLQSTLPGTPTKPKAKIANHPPNAAPISLPHAHLKNSRTKSVSTSPEKSKNGKEKIAPKVKSANLYTMFSNQAQRQGPSTSSKKSVPSASLALKDEEDDFISDDDEVDLRKAGEGSTTASIAKKRGTDLVVGGTDLVSGSQKFMRATPVILVKVEEDTRPWADRFAPLNLDELAVHKKKVSDVRGWLDSVLAGQVRQRVLILKGAAGTGKTTTIQLIARAMNCEVLEWRNPVSSVASSEGFVSIASQFEEFIGRGGRFGQLSLVSDDASIPSIPEVKPLDRRKRLILVEDFPDTFTRSSAAMQSFRSAILQYLASNVPPPSAYGQRQDLGLITPLVMVISETLLTTSTASADSFTAHRLFGPDILRHPGVTMIEFNAMAPTLLAKALELVVVKEARKSGRRRTPGPLVLKRLGEIGDVRSAIASLEFLCLRGDNNGDWGAKIAFTKGKKSKDIPMTKMEEDSLELVTRRETSLGIFHAVGRVVYNKRDDIPPADTVENLPEWLEDRTRAKKSQIIVEELMDETGTDTSTFVAALHENYILSCDANTSDIHDYSDLDHVNGCIDALSDSDLLCPSWDGSFNSTGLGGRVGGRGSGGDILRQDELCFQLAVRGVLFSLPYPVKRRAPANGSTAVRGGAQFKMFYPTSLKLWRQQEQIQSVIDLYVSRTMNGSKYASDLTVSNGPTTSRNVSSFGNERHASYDTGFSQRQPLGGNSSTIDHEPTSQPVVSSTARKQMLLERLPYMAMISKASRNGNARAMTREMEKVTKFTGIDGPSPFEEAELEDLDQGAAADEGANMQETWSTDRPGEEGNGGIKGGKRGGFRHGSNKAGGGGGMGGFQMSMGLEERFAEQRLVLSDDDIEDYD